MENVMTNGFVEFSAENALSVDGGWYVTFGSEPVTVTIEDKDFKAIGRWYNHTLQGFGGRVYDAFHPPVVGKASY